MKSNYFNYRKIYFHVHIHEIIFLCLIVFLIQKILLINTFNLLTDGC
jgi:hypothetical protein